MAEKGGIGTPSCWQGLSQDDEVGKARSILLKGRLQVAGKQIRANKASSAVEGEKEEIEGGGRHGVKKFL